MAHLHAADLGRPPLAVSLSPLPWGRRAREPQAVYGGIAGTVTDSSRAAVAEARLTITSL
jgi:hypothetical protein